MNEERIPVWIGGLDRRSEIEAVVLEVMRQFIYRGRTDGAAHSVWTAMDRAWSHTAADQHKWGADREDLYRADANRPRGIPDDAPDPEKVREYVNAAAETIPPPQLTEDEYAVLDSLVNRLLMRGVSVVRFAGGELRLDGADGSSKDPDTIPAGPVRELVDAIERKAQRAPLSQWFHIKDQIGPELGRVKAHLAGPGKAIPVDDVRVPSPNLESGCSGVPVVEFASEGLAIDPDRKGAWHILMGELATGQVGLVIKAGCSERYLFLRLRRAKVFRDRVIDAVADVEKAIAQTT